MEGRQLELEGRAPAARESYNDWEARRRSWRDLTCRALASIFSTSEASDDFHRAVTHGRVRIVGVGPDIAEDLKTISDGIRVLESYSEQLEYITTVDAPDEGTSDDDAAARPSTDGQVFVVHGRDEALKTLVCRTLERTGEHDVVVLHERPNSGRTIIEKFEQYASVADYAVILATGDDLGRLNPAYSGQGEQSAEAPRARQNVIFELGYFVGKLGRSRVAVLYEPGVELPSDYHGVTYTELDPSGRWAFELLRELRSAGLSFDLNKLT